MVSYRRRKLKIGFVDSISELVFDTYAEYIEDAIKEAEDKAKEIFEDYLQEFSAFAEELGRNDYVVKIDRIRGPRVDIIATKYGTFSIPRITVSLVGQTFNGKEFIHLFDLLDAGRDEKIPIKRWPKATPLFNLRPKDGITNPDNTNLTATPVIGRVARRPNLPAPKNDIPADLVFVSSPAVGPPRTIDTFEGRNIYDNITKDVNAELRRMGNPIRFSVKD